MSAQRRLARWMDRAAGAERDLPPVPCTGFAASSGAGRLASACASDLGFDRRDGDHRRARRRLAVRGRGAGRACLVLRPHPAAAGEGAGDRRGAAGPGDLHPGLAGAAPPAAGALPPAHRAVRAGAGQRHERAGRPSGLGRPAADRPAACAGRGLFPAHRRDRLRDAPRRRPGAATISRAPTSCWSASRAPPRRRPASTSPIAASRPPTCRSSARPSSSTSWRSCSAR